MLAVSKRLPLVFLLGLLAGVGGESLLYFQGQCVSAERALREDFRVVLFLPRELEGGKEKILEEQLRSLDGVADVEIISRAAALARLKLIEPELVESVVLVGDNPLLPAFEVRLAGESLGHIEDWINQALRLGDWADIRYKEAEVEAILKAQFYGRFLSLVLSALVCLVAAMALAALWSSGSATLAGGRRQIQGPFKSAAVASAGAAFAGVSVYFMLLPMRQLSAWWAWPSAGSQVALVFGAAVVGWALGGDGD